MDRHFISKKNKRKLALLSKLAATNNTSPLNTTQFLETYQMTIQTLKKDIADLNHDLAKNNRIGDIKVETSNYQRLYLASNSINVIYLIDKMQVYYIHENKYFKIILDLLKNHYTTIKDLADRWETSLHSMYKNIQYINEILLPFKCQIKFSDEKTNLVGDELGCRLFIFYFYWYAHKNVYESFGIDKKHYSMPDLQTTVNISYTDRRKIELIYWLFYFRKEHGYTIEGYDEFVELADHIPKIVTSETLDHKENVLLNYFVFHLLPNLEFFTNYNYLEKTFFTKTNEIVYIKNLIDSFFETGTCSWTDSLHKKYVRLIIDYYLYISFINIDYSNFVTSNTDYSNKKMSNLENLLSHYAGNSNVTNFYLNSLYSIVSVQKSDRRILIYCQFYEAFLIQASLKNRLLSIFNNSSIEFVDCYGDSNLLITDKYDPDYKGANQFYCRSYLSEKEWMQLLDLIFQEFLKYNHVEDK